MRTGKHEGYARIVFDWGKRVDFAIDETPKGKVFLSFTQGAKLDLAGADIPKLGNITGLKLISTQPLKVELEIAENSRLKGFYIGGRFVLDVYDPKNENKNENKNDNKQTETNDKTINNSQKIEEENKPKEKAIPQENELAEQTDVPIIPPKKPQPKMPVERQKTNIDKKIDEKNKDQSVTSVIPKEEEVTEEKESKLQNTPQQSELTKKTEKSVKIELVPETENAAQPPPLPDNHGSPVPELHEEKLAAVMPVPIEKQELPKTTEKKEESHVFTVTSTSSVNLGVFENGGEIWFVANQNQHHLKPVINGPRPYIFSEIQEENLKVGKAFHNTIPENSKLSAQGGGLIWRLIVTSEKKQGVLPIEPIREINTQNQLGGGKLIWPLRETGELIDINDPISGRVLKVVTVSNASQFAGTARHYVEFDTLNSPVGLTILPKVDDLEVKLTTNGVEISRPGGLNLLPQKLLDTASFHEARTIEKRKNPDPHALTGPRIFNFMEWQAKSVDALETSKNMMLATLNQNTKSAKVEELVTLAKMYLAHGFGAEALGFLGFAEIELPDIGRNIEFIALRGMANAFDRKSEIALADLLNENLKPFSEIGYWQAFVLADLGDWKQAYKVLPSNFNILEEYPDLIAKRLGLVLAEVCLRAGEFERAEEILGMIDRNKENLNASMEAAMKYLQGETFRQKGEKQETLKLWQELSEDTDDLYRTKAGLALTRLLEEEGKINNQGAIDRLERLRYAWRGDELEAQINYWLGRAYCQKKDYVKGLGIMRDAVEIAGDTELGKRIASEMSDVFINLYLGPELKNISALDAVALYDQFNQLAPVGEKRDHIEQMLAEHLVTTDVLGRAAAILQSQVDRGIQSAERLNVAKRLAVIYLLDGLPKKAFSILEKISSYLQTQPQDGIIKKQNDDVDVLKARAFAQDGKSNTALAMLKQMPSRPEVNRLRADIAWKSGFWRDAAEALNDVLQDQNLLPNAALTEKQAEMALNRAVALSLANDRIGLANMREKYLNSMKATAKGKQFEVITRPRRNTILEDRETLMSIVSEVDLFKDFLDTLAIKPETNKPKQTTGQ